ncbi:unnamed protein product [Paramecium primaurelia]|uniref:Transmembrane protein n=1 Tax=Paramecium primaurelia TaxID=5886 RepID=A0A8S1Q9R4_PARPR|nr:unnamed protein product [Paramecium primaurelia]
MNLLKLAFDEKEFYQNPTLIENMEFILIDALKTEISIQINCIFNYENILFYVTITLNQLNQSFEQNILKILRNMQEKEKIIYTDKNFAIFGNYPYYTIFDLRQEQQFYDSIVKMKNDFRMVIQDYNNTHYILFNPQIQEAYLIEIGYEINILNKEKTSECVLIAENNISKAEIQVFYQYEEFNNNLDQKNIIIISIIIICIFIVIIIFIIRRQKLKKHNQKLFQSISQLDQSKLQ